MMLFKITHLVQNSFFYLFFLVYLYQVVDSLKVLASELLAVLQAFEELWSEGMWSCQHELIIIGSLINAGACSSILFSIDEGSCLEDGEMDEPL